MVASELVVVFVESSQYALAALTMLLNTERALTAELTTVESRGAEPVRKVTRLQERIGWQTRHKLMY
jgi:hypothetical protein